MGWVWVWHGNGSVEDEGGVLVAYVALFDFEGWLVDIRLVRIATFAAKIVYIGWIA